MKKRTAAKRIAAVLAAMLLGAAMVLPAGAQTVSLSETAPAVLQSAGNVQAQSVSVKKNLVGKTEVMSYLPYQDGASKTVTVKADLTGNGKKDKIKIKAATFSDSYNIKKITITVNGKKALTCNFKKNSFAQYLTIQYLRQSKNKEFINIYISQDSEYTTMNKVYQYNKKTKKLKCVLNLVNSATTGEWGESTYISSVSKKYITGYYRVQPYQTGTIYWHYKYAWKNGKFKIVSKTVRVKSGLGSWEGIDYQSYFAKNQFITQKKLKLYKSAGSKKVSATIAAGKTVTLKKVCCKNGKIYLKFTCGSKSGWTRVGSGDDFDYETDSTWFYGIEFAG